MRTRLGDARWWDYFETRGYTSLGDSRRIVELICSRSYYPPLRIPASNDTITLTVRQRSISVTLAIVRTVSALSSPVPLSREIHQREREHKHKDETSGSSISGSRRPSMQPGNGFMGTGESAVGSQVDSESWDDEEMMDAQDQDRG